MQHGTKPRLHLLAVHNDTLVELNYTGRNLHRDAQALLPVPTSPAEDRYIKPKSRMRAAHMVVSEGEWWYIGAVVFQPSC